MGDVINLRQARKAKKRAADVQRAEANRRKFGRTKAEVRSAELEKRKLDTVLEGARREPDDTVKPAPQMKAQSKEIAPGAGSNE